MKTIKILAVLVAISSLVACNKGGMFCYKENGEVETKTYDLQGFTEVHLCTEGNVYITQEPHHSVQVEASQNILEILKIEVQGSALVLDTKKGKCISGNPTINYYISAPDFNKLEISGSGDMYASDMIDTEFIELKISGSGDIQLSDLKTTELEVDISGSGGVDIAGQNAMESHKIWISGSGDVKSLNAEANHSEINISGSGSTEVFVTESLSAKISGSGDIIYKGNPTVSTDISGSGDVRPY